MKGLKRFIALSLAFSIFIMPFMVSADGAVETEDMAPIKGPEEETIIPDYIKYQGKIMDIKEKEASFSIWVTDDESDPYSGMVFYITEDTILLKDSTRDFISKDDLEIGMDVSGFYSKDTIMLMTAPPQLEVDVLVVRDSEEAVSVHVSKFNDELISTDNLLKIFPKEDTVILNRDGERIEEEYIKGRDLIVFYTIANLSLPAQTAPGKIIVMEEAEIRVFDGVFIKDKKVKLNNPIYKAETVMLPLRQIAEALGYEVKWDNETKSVELIKGREQFSLTIGSLDYYYKGRVLKLDTAPELKDSRTFAPSAFFEKVLGLDVRVMEDGVISIKE